MKFIKINDDVVIQGHDIKLKDIEFDLSEKISIEKIKEKYQFNDEEWSYVSKKIYDNFLTAQKVKRERDLNNKDLHISAASTEEVDRYIEVNNKLLDYALAIPIISTVADFNKIENELKNGGTDNVLIVNYIKDIIMSPVFRSQQQVGRFEKIPMFYEFSKIINAGLLSYYRGNYISSFMTIAPVIEGIILRWYGFPDQKDTKPNFKKIKEFIKKSYQRQPMPSNVLFMEAYVTVANKIFTEHYFKPSTSGASYDNFNRHLALHLLNNSQFITEDNIMRLFLLLDMLSEIYLYEKNMQDPRFKLKNIDIIHYIDIYKEALFFNNSNSLESKLGLNEQ